MTKQIPDKVLHKGQQYILAGLKGTRLFTPMDFGLSSDMMGVATACYRRFFCKYTCLGNEMLLVELSVIQGENAQLPPIEGISAKSDSTRFFHTYQNLRIPCPFSGGLVLVRNPVGLVGHFPSPIDFEEVIEIQFQQGKFQKEIDHSFLMAGLRKQVAELDESLQSNPELSETLRKRSLKERRTDPETKLFDEYIRKIVDKRIALEWSFVADYEQQPPLS